MAGQHSEGSNPPAPYRHNTSTSDAAGHTYPPDQNGYNTSSPTGGSSFPPGGYPGPNYANTTATGQYGDDPSNPTSNSVPSTQGFAYGSRQGPSYSAPQDTGNGQHHGQGPFQDQMSTHQQFSMMGTSTDPHWADNASTFNHAGSFLQSPASNRGQPNSEAPVPDHAGQGPNHGGYQAHGGPSLFDNYDPGPTPSFPPRPWDPYDVRAANNLKAFDDKFNGSGR